MSTFQQRVKRAITETPAPAANSRQSFTPALRLPGSASGVGRATDSPGLPARGGANNMGAMNAQTAPNFGGGPAMSKGRPPVGGPQMGMDRKGPVGYGPDASKSAGVHDLLMGYSLGGRQVREALYKAAFQPMPGGAPPMDPMMGGGMDPSMMGMDPSMMGGMPPGMDPSMMGGMPPMDPAMAAQPGMAGLMEQGPMPPEAMAQMPPAPGAGAPPPGEGTPGQMSLSPEIQQAITTAVQSAMQQGGGGAGGGAAKGPNDKAMMMTMMEKMIDAFIAQAQGKAAPIKDAAPQPDASAGATGQVT